MAKQSGCSLCNCTSVLFSIMLQPGEIIFGDGCSKLCRCAGNYTLECIDNSCDPTEECREVNGVAGCYPKGNNALKLANGDCMYCKLSFMSHPYVSNWFHQESYLATYLLLSTLLEAVEQWFFFPGGHIITRGYTNLRRNHTLHFSFFSLRTSS